MANPVIRTLAALLALAGCDKVFLDAPSVPEYCEREPVTDPLDSDTDGDGTIARDDNCQAVRNPGQFDEDGDCKGDACDACAWRGDVDNASAPDADADGIPDACDRTATSNRFFDGFNAATNQYSLSGDGTWELGEGVFHQRSATGTAFARVGPQVTAGAMHVGFRIPDEVLAGTHAFRIGGFFNRATSTWDLVAIARDEGDPRLWLRYERQTVAGLVNVSQTLLRASPRTRRIRIDLDYKTGAVVNADIAFDDVHQGTLVGDGTGSGFAGLITVDAAADFEFFANHY